MFNKSFITTIFTALYTTLSFAGGMGHLQPPKPPCAAYEFKAGPYVGASIGPRINMTSLPLTYIGAEGTLSAGWGHLWNQRYYLAAEIFGANSANINKFGTFREGAVLDSVRSTWNYGIDIIPGFMVNDKTFIYARGGVVQTRIAVQSQFGSSGVNANGWRVGLGAQTNIYKSLDVRMEYIFALYERITQLNAEGRPFSDQCNIGLVYKFA